MSIEPVELHEMRTEYVPDRYGGAAPAHIVARCSCGEWAASRRLDTRGNALRNAHRQHQADADREQRRIRREDAHAWYARTGHCADCGQPGEWCLCLRPCRCADLHPVGSGLTREAVEVFGAGVDQDGLFEVTP